MKRTILALLFAVAVASAQAPKIPDAQKRFCEILDNWQFRGGYAPGAVPKVDPNPVKAALAPKPPDPGNLFDQLVEVFGTSGTIAGWKGTVTFSVYAQIYVNLNPYCPQSAKAGNETWLWFQTDSAHALAIKSPIGQFLATANQLDLVTFSGNLFYLPAIRFYREGTMDSRGRRNLGPEQFFVMRNSFIIDVTSIAK